MAPRNLSFLRNFPDYNLECLTLLDLTRATSKSPIDCKTITYDHRVWKTGLPVRSAVLKPHAGELVVGWVTTSESSLLMSG
ncbi:L-lysine 2-3-aminomutase [Penicillium fimorum]|uniref:L-lysine 2-3-aminomutase n=1 Tax=Penicillium fimorum TaxID=1882269 RepID=A0A9W9Y5S8_9EURO|nr:L-lysine 2-3-aminomutase [Penicillium fimorum]